MNKPINYQEIMNSLLDYSININDDLKNKIDYCFNILDELVTFKYVYKKYHLNINQDTTQFLDTNLVIKSKSLTKHLKTCQQAYLIVASLGYLVDQKINQLQIIDLDLAYILDACATYYLEHSLDNLLLDLKKENPNLYYYERFSVGFDNDTLKYQKDIIDNLDAIKKIKINISDNYLLTPSKSLTSIVGISYQKQTSFLNDCFTCENQNQCNYQCQEK